MKIICLMADQTYRLFYSHEEADREFEGVKPYIREVTRIEVEADLLCWEYPTHMKKAREK